MLKITTNTNKAHISVSSKGAQADIQVNNNPLKYYSLDAKESAREAQKQASIASQKLEEINQVFNNTQASLNTREEEILETLQEKQLEAIDAVNTAGALQIQAATEKVDEILSLNPADTNLSNLTEAGIETIQNAAFEKLNNPFFFGMSEYFNSAPNNLSWLKSEGQWNSKSVYPDYYDWLSEQRTKGTKQLYAWGYPSGDHTWTLTPNPQVGDPLYGWEPFRYSGTVTQVNGNTITFNNIYSTNNQTVTRDEAGDGEYFIAEFADIPVFLPSEITNTNYGYNYDYAWVINTTDETFRLPLKNGEETYIDWNSEQTILSLPFTVPFDSFVFVTCERKDNASDYGYITVNGKSCIAFENSAGYTVGSDTMQLLLKKGDVVNASGNSIFIFGKYYKAISNDSLYFYVGETIQNANLINAGVISEQLAGKLDSSNVKAYIVETYQNGASWYRIWSDGFCEQWGTITTNGGQYTSVNLLKSYSTNKYNLVLVDYVEGNANAYASSVQYQYNGRFTVYRNSGNTGLKINWNACGYIS